MSDNTLTMSARSIPTKPMNDDRDWDHDSWEITLTFEGRTKSIKFHTGTGLRKNGQPVPPSIGSVLSSIALDASSVLAADSFEEWAADFGYDTDSRKAERTYQACVAQTEQLAQLLGEWIRVIAFQAPDDGDWSEFEGTSIELPEPKE